MDKYELTTLWQNTLGLKNQTNGYQEQVDFLRQAYYIILGFIKLFLIVYSSFAKIAKNTQ